MSRLIFNRTRGLLPAVACGAAAALGSGGASPPFGAGEGHPGASTRAERIIDYGPGVRINWRLRQIELAGVIVQRDAPLELFACSGPAKQHESVVRLAARPQHIFEALGLIGLTPGRPATWDEHTRSAIDAAGDPVDVQVQWSGPRSVMTADARQWMQDAATGESLRDTRWLFTGSYRLEDGRFAADLDGAVVAVVGFPSAVVTLVRVAPERWSAAAASRPRRPGDSGDAPPGVYANKPDDLDLMADPEGIPPLGTPVTVILRPWQPRSASQPAVTPVSPAASAPGGRHGG